MTYHRGWILYRQESLVHHRSLQLISPYSTKEKEKKKHSRAQIHTRHHSFRVILRHLHRPDTSARAAVQNVVKLLDGCEVKLTARYDHVQVVLYGYGGELQPLLVRSNFWRWRRTCF